MKTLFFATLSAAAVPTVPTESGTDIVYGLLFQLATITAGAMALSEWATIPVGTKSPEPNKGTRKRWSCLIYATLMAWGAWWLGWADFHFGVTGAAGGPAWLRALAASLILAICSTGIAWVAVAAKKAALPDKP